MTMGSKTDKTQGRIKEAVGERTDDDNLKHEVQEKVEWMVEMQDA
jgi:uncharacterized protein YjbJ (UPF0337 family)